MGRRREIEWEVGEDSLANPCRQDLGMPEASEESRAWNRVTDHKKVPILQ